MIQASAIVKAGVLGCTHVYCRLLFTRACLSRPLLHFIAQSSLRIGIALHATGQPDVVLRVSSLFQFLAAPS